MRHKHIIGAALSGILALSCGDPQGGASDVAGAAGDTSAEKDVAAIPDVTDAPDIAEGPEAEDAAEDVAAPVEDIAAPVEDVAEPPDTADAIDVADTADTADAPAPLDATPDVAEEGCPFPSPLLGSTPQTAALAESPAQCGQPAHAWLDGPELGQVTGLVHKITIPKQLIEDLAASESWALPRPVEHEVSVDQLRYMTQDRGKLVEATASIAWPTDLPPGTPPRDILLLLHGTTGFTDQCAPSNDLGGQGFAALFAAWGYMVVAPDFIGLKGAGEPTGFPHPYLVGQPTAIASLDAVRAVANLDPEQRGGVCLSPRVVAFGISQGGHAALWVDRLQPYYAAELDLLGTVASVPPTDMLAQVERTLQAPIPGTANTIAMLFTMASWYGGEDHLSELFVPPLDTQIPAALAASCSPGDDVGDLSKLEEVFQPPILEAAAAGTFAALDPWGCYTAESGLTSTSIPRLVPAAPTYGILFVLGADDTLVHTPTERESVEVLCGQGMPIVSLECAGADHIEATIFALPEILDFIDARVAGATVDPATECVAGPAVTCAGTPN